MSKKSVKIISISLLLIWMSVIFIFSAQEATVSSGQSEGLIMAVKKIAEKVFRTEYRISDVAFFHIEHFVRKAAHFSVYALLGVLACNCLYRFSIKKMKSLSLLICLMYAISDEVHQLFVPGRSGQVTDVLIDFAGATVGVMIFVLFCRIFGNRRKV